MSARAGVRGLMTIAAREVTERGALLGLAAAVAVVPFLAPWAGVGDRPLLGGLLSSIMVIAAAVLTGSSVIARDLAEGRLGFFLARPQPWWSIWGGKMLAAGVLTFAAGAIVLVPVSLLGDWQPPAGGWWIAIVAPGVLAVIGTAHALAVAYRARSGWFALDLGMILGLGWLVGRTYRELMRWVDPFDVDLPAAALWFLAAVVTVAGAAQVAQGRADIRRGHRVLSLVVWSLVIPAVAAYVTWGAWVQRPSPADLGTVVLAWPAPQGTWIAVAGRARWPRPRSVMPTFLVDGATGRSVRMGPAFSGEPVFSDDGRRAAWLTGGWSDTPRLMVADLQAGRAEASAVPLPVPPGAVSSIALSAEGSTAAVVQPTQITVFAVGSAQTAVVALTRTSSQPQAVFTSDGRLHVLGRREDPPPSPGLLDVLVLDPAAGRASVTGHIATRGNAFEHWSPGARRIAVIHRPEHRPSLTLHDGATGALLATLVAEGAAGSVSASFLRDGRLAVVEAGAAIRLRVFTPDGAESLSVDVTTGFAFAGVAETAPGVLAVELPFHRPRTADTVLVDASSGRVIRRETGLRPAGRTWFARGATASDSVPPSLFIDEREALVRLDIVTGARRAVLGGN